jgi:hypothetical protein
MGIGGVFMSTLDWYANGDKPFKAWLRKVDKLVTNELGIGIYDLPDKCWRDMFDGGDSPSEAAQEAIDDANMFYAASRLHVWYSL